MNKSQLIDTLAPSFDGNRRSAAQALDTVLETITRTVVTGEKVGITGFGVFEKLDKPARTVRNPATGASVRKKKTSVPRFRAGAELKAYVSGEKKFPRGSAARKAAPAASTAAASTGARSTAGKSTGTKSTGTKSAAPTSGITTASKASSPGKATTARTTRTGTGTRKTAAARSGPAKSSVTRSAGTAPAKKTTKRAAKKS